MPRIAQTELAVLAALGVQPMTGYAVREAIRDQLGHFWSESFGQIYPTLAALAEAGHIEHADPASAAWSLTASGRARMLELLRSDIVSSPPRDGLLLRLFFGAALGPEECARLVAEARARAEQRLGHFWSESFGQIYPTLSALAEAGHIEHADPASAAWTLTASGRARMLELLRSDIVSSPPRDGLLLRLFFGAALGPEECARLVAEARARAEQRLGTFAALRDVVLHEEGYEEHRPYWLMTLSAGEHQARAARAWAEETLAALAELR